jgi:protein-tyrosine-phosphatase
MLRRYCNDFPVAVDSVGTLDLGPAPALSDAVWAARNFRIDLSEHRARPLQAGALESADLAIGFETFHVASAVIEGGAARERAFLMTELAGLLAQVGASVDRRPERTIELAHARRASVSSAAPVRDPVGRSREEFQRTFEQIEGLVAAIAVGLFGDRRVDSSVR